MPVSSARARSRCTDDLSSTFQLSGRKWQVRENQGLNLRRKGRWLSCRQCNSGCLLSLWARQPGLPSSFSQMQGAWAVTITIQRATPGGGDTLVHTAWEERAVGLSTLGSRGFSSEKLLLTFFWTFEMDVGLK